MVRLFLLALSGVPEGAGWCDGGTGGGCLSGGDLMTLLLFFGRKDKEDGPGDSKKESPELNDAIYCFNSATVRLIFSSCLDSAGDMITRGEP